MQFLRRLSPLTLSVFVLLFTIFTNATPLSLRSRNDPGCGGDQVSCETYCCAAGTYCYEGACAIIPSTEQSASSTSSTPNASSSPSAVPKPKKDKPFFNTTIIIALSAGGGVALILLTTICCACHRKRKQGRALLAAYESPDRMPYEAISLKPQKSASSLRSSTPVALEAPAVSGKPNIGTPTTATFNIPQHAATPPPQYRGGTHAMDEKDLFPRYPPQAFQGQDGAGLRSPGSPVSVQNRAVFPVDVLGTGRSSSLPPYSPQRSAFANQQGPNSPQQAAFPRQQTAFPPTQATYTPQQTAFSPTHSMSHHQQTAFSPTQATFSPTQSAFPQHQTAFSPTQAAFSPQQTSFPQQAGFSFAQQGAGSPMHSPPISPMTPHGAHQEMFLPVNGHQPQPNPQPQHGYPVAY